MLDARLDMMAGTRHSMRKQLGSVAALLLLISTTSAVGELAAIHANQLPQETAVLAALDDAQQLEPYSSSWSSSWKYAISKDEVAARLGRDLGFLKTAVKAHPHNVELLLLTGLVARYAYNLDVPESYDATMEALKEAVTLAPNDVRGAWFRASFVCQTDKPGLGAEEFLAIEASRPWEQLPIGFWDDYMLCAEVVNMPAHVLRAADHLRKLHAPDSEIRGELTGMARKRFDAVDVTREYEPKEAWYSTKQGENWEFTGTGCGLRIRVHGDWQVKQIGMSKGACVALFETGPYQATSGKLSPSILILVKRPEENQSVEDFLGKIASPEKYKSEPDSEIACPFPGCLARKITQAGAYGKNGDQRGRVVAFERDSPEFPGLDFETPNPPPTQDAKEGANYYRPNQVLQRMPGKLYYIVLLDVAASIEEPALKDFDFLLKNLKVE